MIRDLRVARGGRLVLSRHLARGTDLSVRENLRYFARVLGVPQERVDGAVELVDLGEQADQVTVSTSGGERARASLATALLGEPYLFDDRPELFDRVGGPLLVLFPFISMFLVTAITMLRERTTGTLERLMTLPLSKLDLLAG